MLSGAWITIKFDRGHAKSVTHLGLKGVEQKDDKAWQGGTVELQNTFLWLKSPVKNLFILMEEGNWCSR